MQRISMPEDCNVVAFRFGGPNETNKSAYEFSRLFTSYFWRDVYPKIKEEYWALYVGDFDFTDQTTKVAVAARMPQERLKELVLAGLNPEFVEPLVTRPEKENA